MPRRLKRSVILEEYAPLSTEKVSRSTLGMSNAPIHVSNATHRIGGAHDEARDQQSGRGSRIGGPFATGASRPLGRCCLRVAVRRLREQRSQWISRRAKKSRRSSSSRLPAPC